MLHTEPSARKASEAFTFHLWGRSRACITLSIELEAESLG